MNIIYLLSITSICWGVWPLLVRLSGVEGVAYGPVVCLFSIVFPFYYIFVHAPSSALASITIPSLTYLIPAGLIIGIGTVTFGLVLQNPELNLSSSVPIINSAMLIVTIIGSAILFGDKIDLQKIVGIIAILAGIYLLRPAVA